MTSLAVGQSNDFELAATVKAAAAAMQSLMISPTLKAIREAATPVFGKWATSLELTRELAPVLLTTDATGKHLTDRAIWVEDATDNRATGWWERTSGAAILDANGVAITKATLSQVMAQATASGSAWQLEQMFSPSSRAAPLVERAANQNQPLGAAA